MLACHSGELSSASRNPNQNRSAVRGAVPAPRPAPPHARAPPLGPAGAFDRWGRPACGPFVRGHESASLTSTSSWCISASRSWPSTRSMPSSRSICRARWVFVMMGLLLEVWFFFWELCICLVKYRRFDRRTGFCLLFFFLRGLFFMGFWIWRNSVLKIVVSEGFVQKMFFRDVWSDFFYEILNMMKFG